MDEYARAYVEKWPDVAERLVELGFSESVRDCRAARQADDRIEDELEGLWDSALEGAVERAARIASGFPLQLLLNAPTIGLVGWVAFETVRRFFTREWLGTDYFVHALVSLGVVWMLSFVVVQLVVRLVGGARIMKRAFAELRARASGPAEGRASAALVQELDGVIRLAARARRAGSSAAPARRDAAP
jgi:hypothetical protein